MQLRDFKSKKEKAKNNQEKKRINTLPCALLSALILSAQFSSFFFLYLPKKNTRNFKNLSSIHSHHFEQEFSGFFDFVLQNISYSHFSCEKKNCYLCLVCTFYQSEFACLCIRSLISIWVFVFRWVLMVLESFG
ncbi:hypothetical protein Droror1_Dr00004848 [Drosera rotundifolia]